MFILILFLFFVRMLSDVVFSFVFFLRFLLELVSLVLFFVVLNLVSMIVGMMVVWGGYIFVLLDF